MTENKKQETTSIVRSRGRECESQAHWCRFRTSNLFKFSKPEIPLAERSKRPFARSVSMVLLAFLSLPYISFIQSTVLLMCECNVYVSPLSSIDSHEFLPKSLQPKIFVTSTPYSACHRNEQQHAMCDVLFRLQQHWSLVFHRHWLRFGSETMRNMKQKMKLHLTFATATATQLSRYSIYIHSNSNKNECVERI